MGLTSGMSHGRRNHHKHGGQAALQLVAQLGIVNEIRSETFCQLLFNQRSEPRPPSPSCGGVGGGWSGPRPLDPAWR